MKPTELLVQEHKIILMVLGVAEREAATLQKTGRANAWTIEKLVDFFQNFADKCHHVKEEKHLFVKMEERGVSRYGGPLGQMLIEHGEGRRHVQAIANAQPMIREGNRDAARNAGIHLAAYARLLRMHIQKENTVLYPMADKVFNAVDQQELSDAFERVESKETGKGVHEKYQALAKELARSES